MEKRLVEATGQPGGTLVPRPTPLPVLQPAAAAGAAGAAGASGPQRVQQGQQGGEELYCLCQQAFQADALAMIKCATCGDFYHMR